jgi:hypothetical protein
MDETKKYLLRIVKNQTYIFFWLTLVMAAKDAILTGVYFRLYINNGEVKNLIFTVIWFAFIIFWAVMSKKFKFQHEKIKAQLNDLS